MLAIGILTCILYIYVCVCVCVCLSLMKGMDGVGYLTGSTDVDYERAISKR